MDGKDGLLFFYNVYIFFQFFIGSEIEGSAAVSQHFAVDPDPDMIRTSICCSNRKALSVANASYATYITQKSLYKSKIKLIYAHIYVTEV